MADKTTKPAETTKTAEGKASMKKTAVTDAQLEDGAGGHKWCPDHLKDPNRKKRH